MTQIERGKDGVQETRCFYASSTNCPEVLVLVLLKFRGSSKVRNAHMTQTSQTSTREREVPQLKVERTDSYNPIRNEEIVPGLILLHFPIQASHDYRLTPFSAYHLNIPVDNSTSVI